jgi:hypothetical protein
MYRLEKEQYGNKEEVDGVFGLRTQASIRGFHPAAITSYRKPPTCHVLDAPAPRHIFLIGWHANSIDQSGGCEVTNEVDQGRSALSVSRYFVNFRRNPLTVRRAER